MNFVDISQRFGGQPRSGQFGGATIADIDNDGYLDFVLTYHNLHPMRIYWGAPGGKLIRSPFTLKADIHGVSIAPRTTRKMEKLMVVSVGGGNGSNLKAPIIFLIKRNRRIEVVTSRFGFGTERTRGRVPVFFDMSLRSRLKQRQNWGGPDFLLINFLGKNQGLRHFAYQNIKGNYNVKEVPGISRANEERCIVTDVDGDGIMEVVQFSILRIFKLVAPFSFKDVTKKVWPGYRNLERSVASVVELDYNNDGRMDLYIARAKSSLVTPRGPAKVQGIGDLLLENRGGFYVEVNGEKAGIPKNTDSMGVTAEDFDNNGYVDVLITTFNGPDILLLNRGNKSFRMVDPQTKKPSNTRGASVLAVDFDRNGRVDYIVGQGFRKQFRGNFHLMWNNLAMTSSTNYLLVRVGNEPGRAVTSLNAIVILFMPRNQKLSRRVGGRGAALGGLSYFDTVHFGIGSLSLVRKIRVIWTSRAKQTMWNIPANRVVRVGKFY